MGTNEEARDAVLRRLAGDSLPLTHRAELGLLRGLDRLRIFEIGEIYGDTDSHTTKFNSPWTKTLLSAVRAGELRAYVAGRNLGNEPFKPNENSNEYPRDLSEFLLIKRVDYFEWCERNGLSLPQWWTDAQQTTADDCACVSVADAANQKHPCFAPELEAAISAWMALFSSGKMPEGQGAIDAIGDWLRKNRPEIAKSQRALERIQKVANPNKVGGAPKTPG